MSDQRAVGIVIVTYHRVGDALNIAAAAIASHGLPTHRVCVVVNGSDPEDRPLLVEAAARGIVIRELPNPGYAAGVNEGVRVLAAECEYVLVATHDVTLEADSIARLSAAMVATPDAGIVAPLLVDGRNPDRVWSAGGSRSRFRRLPLHLHHGVPVLSAEIPGGMTEVDWADGALYLIRTAAFESIGGVEEGYFLYIEDVDLGARLRSRGWKVYCASEVRGVQSPGDAYDVFLSTRNMTLLLRAERSLVALTLWVARGLLSLLTVGWLKRKPFQRQTQRARGLVAGCFGRRVAPIASISDREDAAA